MKKHKLINIILMNYTSKQILQIAEPIPRNISRKLFREYFYLLKRSVTLCLRSRKRIHEET